MINLHVWLKSGEKLCLGETVPIEMMDGSFRNVEIKIINPKYAGDFAWVSQKAAAKVKSGEFGMSDGRVILLVPGGSLHSAWEMKKVFAYSTLSFAFSR